MSIHIEGLAYTDWNSNWSDYSLGKCPRISYNIQDRFQGLEVEKAATDDDINEEGDDFKSKERIEEHNS